MYIVVDYFQKGGAEIESLVGVGEKLCMISSKKGILAMESYNWWSLPPAAYTLAFGEKVEKIIKTQISASFLFLNICIFLLISSTINYDLAML